MFISFFALLNTASFFTGSFQLIFSILPTSRLKNRAGDIKYFVSFTVSKYSLGKNYNCKLRLHRKHGTK